MKSRSSLRTTGDMVPRLSDRSTAWLSKRASSTTSWTSSRTFQCVGRRDTSASLSLREPRLLPRLATILSTSPIIVVTLQSIRRSFDSCDSTMLLCNEEPESRSPSSLPPIRSQYVWIVPLPLASTRSSLGSIQWALPASINKFAVSVESCTLPFSDVL